MTVMNLVGAIWDWNLFEWSWAATAVLLALGLAWAILELVGLPDRLSMWSNRR